MALFSPASSSAVSPEGDSSSPVRLSRSRCPSSGQPGHLEGQQRRSQQLLSVEAYSGSSSSSSSHGDQDAHSIARDDFDVTSCDGDDDDIYDEIVLPPQDSLPSCAMRLGYRYPFPKLDPRFGRDYSSHTFHSITGDIGIMTASSASTPHTARCHSDYSVSGFPRTDCTNRARDEEDVTGSSLFQCRNLDRDTVQAKRDRQEFFRNSQSSLSGSLSDCTISNSTIASTTSTAVADSTFVTHDSGQCHAFSVSESIEHIDLAIDRQYTDRRTVPDERHSTSVGRTSSDHSRNDEVRIDRLPSELPREWPRPAILTDPSLSTHSTVSKSDSTNATASTVDTAGTTESLPVQASVAVIDSSAPVSCKHDSKLSSLPISPQPSPTPQQCRQRRRVRFGSVYIRYHRTILGDNPAVSCGLPITIDWKVVSTETYSLSHTHVGQCSIDPDRTLVQHRSQAQPTKSKVGHVVQRRHRHTPTDGIDSTLSSVRYKSAIEPTPSSSEAFKRWSRQLNSSTSVYYRRGDELKLSSMHRRALLQSYPRRELDRVQKQCERIQRQRLKSARRSSSTKECMDLALESMVRRLRRSFVSKVGGRR